MMDGFSNQVKKCISTKQTLPSDVWSIAIYNKGEEFVGSYSGETLKEVKTDSLYEIGSVTKVFIAMLLAKEMVNGKIQLHEYVHDFFKEHLDGKEGKITLQHLATHTSGLPRLPFRLLYKNLIPYPFFRSFKQNPYANYGEKELIKDVKSFIDLEISPSDTPQYSNFGYAILGYILTTKQNRTFDEAMKTLTLPLQLKNTGYKRTDDLSPPLLEGYNDKGKPVPHWEFDVFAGAGALRSSVYDLLLFLQANLNPPPLMKEAVQLTHQVRVNISDEHSVCLGWQKNERTGWFWHNGGTAGFESFIGFNKDEQQGVVVLCNRSQSGVEEVAKLLMSD